MDDRRQGVLSLGGEPQIPGDDASLIPTMSAICRVVVIHSFLPVPTFIAA